MSKRTIFLQPFAMSVTGGGTRILRMLAEDSPGPVTFVCSHPSPPPPSKDIEERHIPIRPAFGRLDRSRFIGLARGIEPLYAHRFRQQLTRAFEGFDDNACLHLLPHTCSDFYHGSRVARRREMPFVMSVHDDLRYVTRGHPHRNAMDRQLGETWQNAAHRYVICPEIGEEYNRRYGTHPFTVVTDSREISTLPEPAPKPGSFALYFMGLFHNAYYPNLGALTEAMRRLRHRGHDVPLMKMRCGSLTLATPDMQSEVEVLPYVDQAVVDAESREAAFLYLPLPFGDDYENFVRFSFSTKLITYLASGVPILYHGPAGSALGNYLRRHDAGVLVESNDPGAIATALESTAMDESLLTRITRNALDCVRNDFDREKVQRRFWDPIEAL